MAPEPTPRTAAGRALLSHVKGLGPRLDTVTMTARRLRDGVLAIEAEAFQLGIERAQPALDTLAAVAALPRPEAATGLREALAYAIEARDVQQGGSPHITPGNRFYLEAADALIALMPVAALAAPSSPALDKAHEPGAPHRYRIECEVCGQRGTLNLSIAPSAYQKEPQT